MAADCGHATLLAADALSGYQALVNPDVILRHAGDREPLLEAAAHAHAVEGQHLAQFAHGLLHGVDHPTGDAVVDHLRYRTAPEGKHRRAARHRLDHDEAEGLRPFNGEEQGARLA